MRVEDAQRVYHGLQLPHKCHGARRLGVADEVAFLEAEPVLGRDGAAVLRGPLEQARLDVGQHGGVERPSRHVQVQVAVTCKRRSRESLRRRQGDAGILEDTGEL